ncbi:sigma factor [Massilia sp. TN1-12]|uniref:sigma factor n=1 Tax=Massilia paldalensis TaxID=3377675 RepID=UPI00384F86BA
MNETLSFKENIGLVHFHAKRGFARAQQAGVPLSYDDMFQEASLAFVMATRGFDPEAGVKFSAYYTRAAHSHFSKAIGKFTGVKRLTDEMKEEVAAREEENARRRAAAQKELPSIQYGIGAQCFDDIGRPGGEGSGDLSFEETIAGDFQSPEEIIETKQLMDRAMANLSPLANLMVDWLRDPPLELVNELRSQRAHAAVAEEVGVHARAMKEGLSLVTVKKFLTMLGGATERELSMAECELRNAVKYIEEAA